MGDIQSGFNTHHPFYFSLNELYVATKSWDLWNAI